MLCYLPEPHFQYEVYSYLPGDILADEKRICNLIQDANIHTLLVENFALHRIKSNQADNLSLVFLHKTFPIYEVIASSGLGK